MPPCTGRTPVCLLRNSLLLHQSATTTNHRVSKFLHIKNWKSIPNPNVYKRTHSISICLNFVRFRITTKTSKSCFCYSYQSTYNFQTKNQTKVCKSQTSGNAHYNRENLLNMVQPYIYALNYA